MKCSFVIILTAILWMGLQAEDSLTGPEFLSSLLATGKSGLAALEFERLSWNQASVGADLSCRLGNALLKSGYINRAENVFESTLERADADSESYKQAKLGIVRVYLLQRKPLLALNELNAQNEADAPSLHNQDVVFYKSAAFAASYAIDSSKKLLNCLTADSHYGAKAKRLEALFEWYKSRGMKNPINAFVYSSIVPGWGQWYLGDRKKAVTSCVLMAGLSGLLCYEGYRFYHGDLRQRMVCGMDMLLVWGLGWRRYYNGIRKSANQRAIEYNQHVQLEYQKRLREIISE
jgi:hypothetical protein